VGRPGSRLVEERLEARLIDPRAGHSVVLAQRIEGGVLPGRHVTVNSAQPGLAYQPVQAVPGYRKAATLGPRRKCGDPDRSVPEPTSHDDLVAGGHSRTHTGTARSCLEQDRAAVRKNLHTPRSRSTWAGRTTLACTQNGCTTARHRWLTRNLSFGLITVEQIGHAGLPASCQARTIACRASRSSARCPTITPAR
jgi:hypothetical protein